MRCFLVCILLWFDLFLYVLILHFFLFDKNVNIKELNISEILFVLLINNFSYCIKIIFMYRGAFD